MDALSAKKKRILIACSMIEDEIRDAVRETASDDLEIYWEERGHHNDPDKLNRVVQAEITRAEEAGADEILLAYGLCGNGAVGWHSDSATLVMPRFDDCVNLMLCTGARDRRNYLKAGHMYLTSGWMQDSGSLRSMYETYQERYGEKKGLRVMKRMLDSYHSITVIDTGCYQPGPVMRYAEECAGLLGFSVETVPGGNGVLKKMLAGDWDEDILVIRPGDAVRQSDFEFIQKGGCE